MTSASGGQTISGFVPQFSVICWLSFLLAPDFFVLCLFTRLVMFSTFVVLFKTHILGLLCLLLSCVSFLIQALLFFGGLNLSMMMWQKFYIMC